MKRTSVVRALAAFVVATVMGALMTLAAAPDAAANHGELNTDFAVPVDGSDGTCEDRGLSTGSSSFRVGGSEFVRCIFAPSARITTQTQCEAAGLTWNFAGLDRPSCDFFSAARAVFDSGACPAGWESNSFGGVDACVLPWRTSHVGNVYKPLCIEDSMLQDDPAFADLRINSEIQLGGNVALYVHSGAGCTFDCIDGFDANCDGALGDYCRVEIDRKSVAGAGQCIEELNPSVDPLPTVVVHDVPTTLAHTGAETSVIAYFGLGLTAFGATAMGLRRRIG